MCSIIANRGHYYIPHIIKSIGSSGMIDDKYYEKQYCGVDPSFFTPIVEGMHKAVHGNGTAWRVKIPGVEMCGKTGTAENPHGANNSVFICFAPKDDPKIAVAVYVEHGGFGASRAAPIAALMVEKYLKGTITRTDMEQAILATDLIKNPLRKTVSRPSQTNEDSD